MKFVKPTVAIATLALATATGWWLGRQSQPGKGAASSATPAAPVSGDRKILYWYDPMKPEVHFDHPGKSPFMGMPLQPKYADGSPLQPGVSVDPRMAQNLGLRTAAIGRGDFARRIDTVGLVKIDENRIVALTARAQGWVERLNVRAVGDPVRRGQAFAAIYAPQLLATQEELLLAEHGGNAELAAAARRRLALLGAPSTTIAEVERNGQAQRDVPVISPVDGVLTELKVREGDPVSPGMALAQVADLSKVWIEVQVPEAQAGWITVGNAASVTLPALPGRSYKARVDYVYPDLQTVTRTLRVRLAVDNPKLALKPGMYAQVTLSALPQHDVLLVPDQAIISDGRRKLVFLADADGRYRPRFVRLGADDGRESVVLEGLRQGDRVVVSGQFLIDAEANLTGALQRLEQSNIGGKAPENRATLVAPAPAQRPSPSGVPGTNRMPNMPGMPAPAPAHSSGGHR